MAGAWDSRFKHRETRLDEAKKSLRLRIFGPYRGDCSFILSRVEHALQEREGYKNAKLCMSIPDTKSVAALDSGPLYNWEASLECIREGRVGVFIFLEPKEKRFERVGPFQDPSEYDKSTEVQFELNSSVILEFSSWLHMSPRMNDVLVIYEGQMETILGSLIRGRVQSGSIASQTIDSNSQDEAVELIKNAIAGHSQYWLSEFGSTIHT